MNEADSEQIAAGLEKKGYQPAGSIQEADLVVINTCSVRKSAEDRVLGLMKNLKKLPPFGKSATGRKIILTGCMLRYSKIRLNKILPGVDEFIKLEQLTKGVAALRQDDKHAWVRIMAGCDNFCTYCVVPSARGRETSRPIEEIVCEVKELVKRGYREITLLGQNVNSYGKNFKGFKKAPFAGLLQELQQINGLEKISFLTSNPHDMTDDIIAAMKLPKINRYLHLAVQSGDDEILKRMNRKYTVEQYLVLVEKIKENIPDIELGTDIIVGFPGETKAQFNNTVKLCKQVGFKIAYINKYSPRSGTVAYKFKDNVLIQEKKRRWRVLEKLINKK